MLPIRQRAGILIRNRAYSKNHAVLSRGLSRSTVLGLRRKIFSVAVPNLLSFLRLKSSKVISVNKYIHNDYLPQSGHPSAIWDLLHSPLITFLSWLKKCPSSKNFVLPKLSNMVFSLQKLFYNAVTALVEKEICSECLLYSAAKFMELSPTLSIKSKKSRQNTSWGGRTGTSAVQGVRDY